jgi:hypothetical protein
LEMIRQLHEQLNIPTDVLIQAYKIDWVYSNS